jgi:putative membrane protein
MLSLPDIRAFVAGFPDFLIQLAVALGLFAAALVIYVRLTPHKEMKLIGEGNPSAALAFGGVVVGLAIPLGACLANATGLIDLLIWSIITLLLQLLTFRITDMLLHKLPTRIADGDVAAAITLMAMKLGVAIVIAGAIEDPNLALIRAG